MTLASNETILFFMLVVPFTLTFLFLMLGTVIAEVIDGDTTGTCGDIVLAISVSLLAWTMIGFLSFGFGALAPDLTGRILANGDTLLLGYIFTATGIIAIGCIHGALEATHEERIARSNRHAISNVDWKRI